MSTKNDNNSMVILGASAIALLGIFGIYSTMNDDVCNEDNEYSDDENEYDDDDEQRRWEMERWESRNEPHVSESYCNSGNSVNMPPQPTTIPPSEAYSPPPFQKPLENFDPSPLGFSTMAGGSKEAYNFENNSGLSDYEDLKGYDNGSQNIPIYNEQDGQIGLPVPDMSDISAGENNKYVYDRTIGTIGFTSTKIGGRKRGQADYIRGDLAIIPDKNTSFQVSADPINSLLPGAMNISNGIGSSNAADISNASQFGAQMAMNPNSKPILTLDDARRELLKTRQDQQITAINSSSGGQNAIIPRGVLNNMANEELAKSKIYESSGGVFAGGVQALQALAVQDAIADNKQGYSTYFK